KLEARNPPLESVTQPSDEHDSRRRDCARLAPHFLRLSFSVHICVAAVSSVALDFSAMSCASAKSSAPSNFSQLDRPRQAIGSRSQPTRQFASATRVSAPE